MALPLEQLLSPVSDNPPCGDNKFDDYAYGSLLDSDLQDIFGDEDMGTQEGERKEKSDGDWPSFLGKVISYFGLTKHLSLAYYATLADVNLSGIGGLVDGLTLVRQLLARYWDEVHPVLDDGDPWERDDALRLFESADMLKSISNLTVASGRQAGTYTLKEAMASKDTGVPEVSVVEAAINETLISEPTFYDDLGKSLAEVRETLEALKKDLENIEADFEVTFAALEERLGYMETFLAGVNPEGETAAAGENGAAGEEGSAPGSPTAAAGGVIRVNGEINSRADVAKAIDRIIRFYTRSEPSSPVPQLLVRVKRVVDMNFTEIIDEFGLNRQSFDADSIFGSINQD